MSHHPGCPKNQSLYAYCECAAIDQRSHTEALNRHADQMRDNQLHDILATASLHEEIGELKALLKRTWELVGVAQREIVWQVDDLEQEAYREMRAELEPEIKKALS